ncbi:MAG: ATP-binding protein [Actinomycetes bacterium]|nr:MAG: ATP-binding protein [Actinomycetota bacterium]
MSASSVVLLPYAPSSVAVARQRLSADLRARGIFAADADDAVLVMSELLSNALRHAHPLPSGQVRVAWEFSGENVEVRVTDGGAATAPRAGRATLSSLGGRGLSIVEYLAERWGVHYDDDGTTVWAVLRVSRDPAFAEPAAEGGGPGGVNGHAPAGSRVAGTEMSVLGERG